MASLRTEMHPDATPENVFRELRNALELARNRVRVLVGADLEANRMVGRQALPATLGGLLVHVADHTQRHVGPGDHDSEIRSRHAFNIARR